VGSKVLRVVRILFIIVVVVAVKVAVRGLLR
jgi:hypothetical protein